MVGFNATGQYPQLVGLAISTGAVTSIVDLPFVKPAIAGLGMSLDIDSRTGVALCAGM